MKGILFFSIAIVLSFNLNADDDLSKQYIEQFSKQIQPIYFEKFSSAMKNIRQEKVTELAKFHSKKAAKCQLEAIRLYPDSYYLAIVKPIANGQDIYAVTKEVDTMFENDIASGKLIQSEFLTMVEKVQVMFAECINS